MKKLLLLLFAISLNAQDSVTGTITPNISASYNGGMWFKTSSKSSSVKGSTHLFDKWKNTSKIYSVGDRVQSVSYLNYNILTNNFESKLLNLNDPAQKFSTDSVYVFDSNSINKVFVNNRKFLKVNNPITSKTEFMELISKSNSFELYKSASLSIVEGKLNPLTQQPMSDDKYEKHFKYFIKNNDGVKVFKIRKKSLLKQLEPHSKAVNDFIIDNKLNVKNDSQLKRVLNYYNSL